MSGEVPGSTELGSRIRSLAGPCGFLPFDRFMDLALYAEGVGYYTSGRTRLGPHGDFYTAAHVHPLFARTIARRILEVRQALGGYRPFSIVELGPGDGTLAEGIVRSLDRAAGSGGALEYVLVERSSPLRTLALARARAAGEAAGVRVRERPGLSTDGPFSGVVIASEVLDAQPVRRFRWTGSEWLELGVRWEGDRVVAAESRPDRSIAGAPLAPADREGLVAEVSSGAEALVREVADHLVRGEFVVLDYGMDEDELRSGHPSGTLAAVRSHRDAGDPFGSPGENDLSTFVNFTRVRSAARAAGLVELGFDRQAEALGRWGFPTLLAAELREARTPEEEVRTRLAAKNLAFGFDRFRVLELAAPASAEALAQLRSEDPAGGR